MLPLVVFSKVPVSPFFQPAVVPLDDSTTLWHISHSQFCVICSFAVGVLCPIIQVIAKGVEQDWPQ